MDKVIDIAQKVKAKRKSEQNKYQTEQPDGQVNSKLILTALESNEDGDAMLFIKTNQKRFCFDHSQGKWFRFDKHAWREDNTQHVNICLDDVIDFYDQELTNQLKIRQGAISKGQEKVQKIAESIINNLKTRISNLHTLKRKNNIIKLAAMGDHSLGISGKEWDQKPELFACRNGVINLRTGEFGDGNPDDFIKMTSDTEWRGLNESAPEWEKFLMEIFDGDTVLIDFMQRLFGYAVTGLSVENILVILIGEGRNGKTTLLETIYHTIGPYGSPVQSESFMKNTFVKSGSDHSADIVAFKGRRLLFSSETEMDIQLNESRVKWLTGGDTITARAPHAKNSVTFQPSHKIFINTNHLPIIKDPTASIWERVIPVEFICRFVDDPEDQNNIESLNLSPNTKLKTKNVNLKEKLMTEAPGILAWLVRGSKAYFERGGLMIPEKVRLLNQEYQIKENSVYDFFNACLVKDDSREKLRASTLYKVYEDWCDQSCIIPENSTIFGTVMTNLLFKGSDRNGKFYTGVSLRPVEEKLKFEDVAVV